MNVSYFTSLNNLEAIIDVEVATALIKQNAGLNTLRHKATNYDTAWRVATKLAKKSNVNVNRLTHYIQNLVNEELTKLIYKVKNQTISVKATSITTASADSIELQYLRAGVSNTAAKLLADSKAANAAIRGVAVVTIPTSTTVDTFKW